MLQRAASNAYSWWWASHIRTKQSKWLEQNLQDMEDKVQTVLKILEEDGDSFAKRAEMYYKKRPELISFVEEAYRAYRSLAERYDHISTELQNANSTIATVFPERVQFPLDDEEDYNNAPPQFPKVMPNPSTANNNIPKVPTTSTRDLKGLLKTATRELKTKRPPKVENKSKNTPKSGLSKSEAIEEIDRLEKEILALQTVKEFVKSSYESGLKKHWEIENQITDLQERVFSLEDEFKVGRVIEDDEARTIMAEAALKSCQEMLAKLHEKQEISSEKAKAESERVENARGKLKSLKKKLLPDHEDHVNIENEKEKQEISSEKARAESERVENARGKLKSLKKKLLPDHEDHVNIENEKEEAQMDKKKIAEVEFLEKNVEEMGPKGPLTVTGLVDKIDELVNEVISLETAVSSQTALLDRLRTETDDLQAQVRALEGDKVTLVDDRDSLNDKLKEMEEKLKKLEKLNQNVENENKNLNNHFVGAHSSHDFLSEKLYSVRPDEEIEQEDTTLEAEEKGLKEMKNIQHLKSDVADEKDKPVPRISADNQTQKDEENKILNKKNLESAVTKEEDKQDHDSLVDNKEGLKSAVTTENDKQVSAISEDIAGEKASQILINNGNKTESFENQEVSKAADDQNQDKVVKSEPGDVVKEKDDDMNWQEMLLNGLEDREKVLLTEYTAILRNFKEVKKQLTDVEKKKEDSLFEMTLQLREQKVAVSRRDQEIRSLRQKLNLLQDNSEEMKDLEEDSSLEISSPQNEEIIKWMVIDQSRVISPIEEKLRTEIDALLDQNLDFWLRFSTSFHQIQKYRNGYEDLQAEIKKIKEKGKPNRESSVGKSNRESSVGKSNRESSSGKSNRESSAPTDIRSELRPIYRHLTEIQTELTVWIDQSALLRDELQRRFSSLCNIQEDITTALKAGAEEEEMRFTSHEAAKFQGEVVNMKQENYKVRDELEAGLEHVTALQHEIRKTVADLIDELGLSGQRTGTSIFRNSNSRSRVPLRSFIFGSKAKRKSLFACMHPKKIQEI